MVGIPVVCQTKEDWQNAVEYAIATGDGRSEMVRRLQALKDNHFKLVLKESSKDVPAEEQTTDDFEPVDDPAAEKYRILVTDDWIDEQIRRLANA